MIHNTYINNDSKFTSACVRPSSNYPLDIAHPGPPRLSGDKIGRGKHDCRCCD